jgi:hypothetical protein
MHPQSDARNGKKEEKRKKKSSNLPRLTPSLPPLYAIAFCWSLSVYGLITMTEYLYYKPINAKKQNPTEPTNQKKNLTHNPPYPAQVTRGDKKGYCISS